MSFQVIKKYFQNKISEPKRSVWEAPSYAEIKVGSVIDFTKAESSLVVATLVENPVFQMEQDHMKTVMAKGKIHDGSFDLYRFYFTNEKEFLQVVVNPEDNTPVEGETKLFRFLEEVNPESAEEWDLWLEGTEDQAPLLTGKSINFKDVEFFRLYGGVSFKIDPREYAEIISNRSVVLHEMDYYRVLGAGTYEYLKISVHNDVDSRWIETYVGLSLKSTEFTII